MGNTVTEFVRVKGYKVKATEKAILFECHEVNNFSCLDEDGDPKKEWFPLSQVERCFIHKDESEEMDWIEVPNWLLRKKELL